MFIHFILSQYPVHLEYINFMVISIPVVSLEYPILQFGMRIHAQCEPPAEETVRGREKVCELRIALNQPHISWAMGPGKYSNYILHVVYILV